MVRIEGASDYDRLDAVVRALVGKHELKLETEGWTRKTYLIYRVVGRAEQHLVARVESFATTNGEIVVFDDAAIPFAQDLGAALEADFGVAEAVVVRRPR